IEDQEDRLGQRVSSPHSGVVRFWVAGKQYLGQLSPCSRSAGRQNRAVCNERHHYLYHGEPARPPFLAYLDRNWFWNDCCARDSGTPRRSISIKKVTRLAASPPCRLHRGRPGISGARPHQRARSARRSRSTIGSTAKASNPG